MKRRVLRLGISPCPNDTFTFHGLLSGAVRAETFDLEFELHDVESLNAAFARGEFDASKASFFAALPLAREALVLRAGAALGFGVGPLLLARPGAPPLAEARVLSPGERTTAHFLLRSFHPELQRVEHTLFSAIMPRLAQGTADYGVCIHEGRFTYARHGLELHEDLGTTWEDAVGAPLPLGGILARRSLGTATLHELDSAIRRSLDHARAHPLEALVTMRAHARELEDAVIEAHVALYVNEWTLDLGATGARALAVFGERARRAGLAPADAPALEILQ
ncbi:MAG: 1,4-dihydroxy-6-naphthoate synthase [Planctomycetes bacterium]|nr:1,4-dihydroxy-6-naphthoate synthase [Planctomycetota bacterium]